MENFSLCYILWQIYFFLIAVYGSQTARPEMIKKSMNRTKHFCNVINLCIEFCYSTTGYSVVFWDWKLLQMKGEGKGEAEYRSSKWSWIGFRQMQEGCSCEGCLKGLWGSAGSDTGGGQGGTYPVGTGLYCKLNQTCDNGFCFSVLLKSAHILPSVF